MLGLEKDDEAAEYSEYEKLVSGSDHGAENSEYDELGCEKDDESAEYSE